jgi:hypothetical protein
MLNGIVRHQPLLLPESGASACQIVRRQLHHYMHLHQYINGMLVHFTAHTRGDYCTRSVSQLARSAASVRTSLE